MRVAEEYGKSIGIKTILLHVEESNVPALKFYENRNFSVLFKQGSRLMLIKNIS